MHRVLRLLAVVLALAATPSYAQNLKEEAAIRAAVPYATVAREIPGLTIADYEAAVRALAQQRATTRTLETPFLTPRPMSKPQHSAPPSLVGEDGTYLGTLSNNPYDPNSISNPYGRYGNPYSPDSVNNPYGKFGSPYSPYSATNPYATQAPRIVNPYLGRLSANPYAPESVSKPFGKYGSPYSPSSITNPYGLYGNPFSPSSVANPHAVSPIAPLAPISPLTQRYPRD